METLDTMTNRKMTPTARLVLSANAPREEWLAARRSGITATDMVAIMGQSKYRTAFDVWTDKLMPPFGQQDEETHEAAFWGLALEEPVAQAWANKHGLKVRRIGLVSNEYEPWQMASLDRLVSGCPDGRCALEVKTRSLFVSEQWEKALPEDVVTQCIWQLLVTGLDHIHVAALIGGQRMVEHVVRMDSEKLNALLDAGWLVWDAVKDATPPNMPPALWSDMYLEQRYPERAGAIEVGDDVLAALEAYKQASDSIAHHETLKDEARLVLVGALGEAEAATRDGKTLYTYKAQTSRRINSKALKEFYPETAADDRLWNTTSSRVLRTTKENA